MEFHIGEINSTVRMTDSQSMVAPDMFERLVRAVLARVREEREYAERAGSERRIERRGME